MTNRNFVLLLVVLVIVGMAYFLLVPCSSKKTVNSSQELVLKDIDVSKVASIVIEQSDKSVELRIRNDSWSVAQRGDYPANEEKIRSLLLKVFDIAKIQLISTTESGHAQLGVNDEGVKNGRSKVRFLDSQGKELGGLYVGNMRESKKDISDNRQKIPASLGGQYVRNIDSKEVYLIPSAITVSADISSWLDSNILSVLQSKIIEVEQYKIDPSAQSLVFKLSRLLKSPSAIVEAKDLVLEGELSDKEELQSAVISQVGSGLENLRINDVKPMGETKDQSLVFDMKITYKSSDALVYNVWTSKSQDKIYAKIEVQFDEELAEKLKKEAVQKAELEAKAKKEEEDRKKAEQESSAAQVSSNSSSIQQVENQSSVSSSTSSSIDPVAALGLASSDEATKLNSKLSAWIFELSSYQGERFRKSKSDLLKPKEEPKADAVGEMNKEMNAAPLPRAKK